MRRAVILLALTAAVLMAGVLSMPPPALSLDADGLAIPDPVRGAIHVHTRRSDGSGTIEQVAAAASRAGLDYVVLSDHGDAVRLPEAPAYIHGVLVIDAVEVSTFEGHLLVLGLDEAAPYPLGGEARGVIEDVARVGGFTIAAHPSSSRPDLRWDGWDLPVDGLEWLNADTEWRDEGPVSLARALFSYPWRRAQALAMVFDRPGDALRRWDELTAHRRVAAIAGADAHANLGFGGATANRYGDRALLAIPAYEHVFRAFSVALPAVTLTGEARADAQAVLEAVRAGRSYSSIDARAAPARLDFRAESGGQSAGPGDVLRPAGPVTFRVRTSAPAGAHVRLLKAGEEVAAAQAGHLDFETAEGGAYRVEVSLPDTTAGAAPWLLSNPVYVGTFPPAVPRAAPPRGGRAVPAYPEGPAETIWSTEKSEASRAVLEIVPLIDEGVRRRLRYALGGAESSSAFAALVMQTGPDLSGYSAVAITAVADKPMRIWLHLQVSTPGGGRQYWRRSLYVGTDIREIVIPFADLSPVDDAPAQIPLSDVDSLAFVVERTHTPLGTSGTLMVDEVLLRR